MTPKKTTGAEPAKDSSAAESGSGRKAWVRKSPVEHVLDQINKQAERVAELEKELQKEKQELTKLEAARKVLEGK
jgi:hypothetical protein